MVCGRARAVVCVQGGAGYVYYGAVVVVPAALALLALPWYGWFSNVGALYAATPRDLPSLPRSPSTEHRAGLYSVGERVLYECPSWPHHGRAGRCRRAPFQGP